MVRNIGRPSGGPQSSSQLLWQLLTFHSSCFWDLKPSSGLFNPSSWEAEVGRYCCSSLSWSIE